MVPFFVFVSFIGTVVSSVPSYYKIEDAEMHFKEFMQKFNKEYWSEQEKQGRFEIFKNNLITINAQNNGSSVTNFGINKFSDLTEEEYMSMYNGFKVSDIRGAGPCKNSYGGFPNVSAPEEWDWRKQNKVTRVKDQFDSKCGSCWAFSTAGNIEGQYAIKHNQLVEFSVQQLVDCDKSNSGCGGGLMDKALLYLTKAGGIMSWQDYPYQAKQAACKFDQSKVKAKVTGCTQYFFSNEDQLKETLFNVGPLTVGVDPTNWRHYDKNILHTCGQGSVMHAVLLVGYGTENGVPYWIIKNSSGPNWGEAGYIRIKRNENACNIMLRGGSCIVNAQIA